MGNIEDFLSRVVPWPASEQDPGLVNLHYTSPRGPGMRGKPFKVMQDMLGLAQYGAAHPAFYKDIYFCLSSQKSTGKMVHGKATALRNAKNVYRLKALWMDIDVKPEKGYATVDEAVGALSKFIATANLPPPSAIVLSGSGVHVYWISDTPLTEEEWRPYAEGLEALAKIHGLRRDPGLTTDSVRVLRVPGTFNFKTTPPKGVRLAALSPHDINFAAALAHIRVVSTTVTAPVTKPVGLLYDPKLFPQRAPTEMQGIDSLAAGMHVNDDTPLDYAEVVKNCPHFRATAQTKGAGTEQGLWMLDVLATTFMQDARPFAHYLSKGYKTYTPGETDAMFDRKVAERTERGLGWPSCEAFENAGSKECAGCIFKGKIRSPLNLAIRSAPIHPIAVAPPPPPDMHLPTGYTLSADTGAICAVVEKVLEGGGTSLELAPLFRCKITNPWAETNGLRFTASVDMGRTKEVIVPESAIGSDQGLMKCLWNQSVKTYVENERRVRGFMSAWLEMLDDEKKRLATVPYGWIIEDGKEAGFAYNGTVYRKDGHDHPAGTPDPELKKTYTPQGTIGPWRDAMKVITDQHRPALEALAAMAFGAPLLPFAGQYAGILIGWGESAAHKSTALRAGLAVWGNPKFAKDVPTASNVFIEGRLSTLKNLPMVWDELSDPEKLERVVRLAGTITEGVAGGKQRQDKTNRPTGDWCSLITIGANTSVWDQAIKVTKSTDAQLRRLFEMKVPKVEGHLRKSDVANLTMSLDNNYGWAGVMYAEYLGRNPDQVRKDTQEILHRLEDELNVKDEERFWCAVVATIVAGAEIANRVCQAGFDVGELHHYMKEAFLRLRTEILKHAVVGGSEVNVSAILTQFFKAFPNNHLWVDKKHIGRGRPKLKVIHQHDVLHPAAVHIQWVRDDRVVRISLSKFREFVDSLGTAGQQSVMDGLGEHFHATVPVLRADLAAGSVQTGGSESVIEIPIPPGHDLEGQLFDWTPLAELPANYGVPNALAGDPSPT